MALLKELGQTVVAGAASRRAQSQQVRRAVRFLWGAEPALERYYCSEEGGSPRTFAWGWRTRQ